MATDRRRISALGASRALRACVWILAAFTFAWGMDGGPAGASAAPAAVSEALFGHIAVAPAPLPSLALARAPRRLRVVAVVASYGVSLPKAALPATVRLAVGPAGGAVFAAYATPLGGRQVFYLVGPVGAAASGSVGADGSFEITLRKDGAVLTATSDSACYGCALGHAGPFFPALARRAERAYGFDPGRQAIARLKGRLAYRRAGADLVVYAFRDVAGDRVEGFVAAPMSLRSGLGLVYSAQWVGPPSQAVSGAAELAVALSSLGA